MGFDPQHLMSEPHKNHQRIYGPNHCLPKSFGAERRAGDGGKCPTQ